MPTYDFRCPNGHEFERFYRKISDAPSATECPECHAQAERRVSGGAGLLFKGSGFYITDYGKDGKKDQRAKTSAGESKTETKAETKSESKGEAKSEGAPAAKPAESKPAPSKREGKSTE